MDALRPFFVRCSTFLAVSIGMATQLWAQVGAEEEPKESWVTGYALVILSVGLGLFVICRPGKRSKKVKAEAA